MTLERLQKVMAHAGVASRRACEAIIQQGRVTVNGKVVTELGVKVDPHHDEIVVDGRSLFRQAEKPVYIILNKPAGILSAASDEQRGRKTVVDLVDVPERVYPVGRLDLPSQGLILLTNDGELAQQITHPSSHLEKEYQVLVSGHPSAQTLARWRQGDIEVEGKPTAPAVVERLNPEGENFWLKIILTEGRKRQIREVAKILGHPVLRLERIRIGPLKLGRLKPGHWRHLSPAEVHRLKESIKLARQGATASTRAPARRAS
ncbi:MAG: rRNA pseudouridine synthase [Anaerolineae bacterium]|nr:rRNA pseudouridine synthase [Anaerolineae bacterium]